MFAATRSAALGVLGAILISAGAHAQDATATAARQNGGGNKLITPADLKAWNGIRQNVLSNDGKWFAYVVSPTEGDATLVLRGTAQNATETRIPVGNGGGSIAISGDSKWMGYLIAPPRPPVLAGQGRGRGAGRGGQGQGADTARARPNVNKFVLMNLATSEKKEFDRIRRFNFSSERPEWIALQGYPPEGAGTAAAAPGGGGGRGGRGGGAPAEGGATAAGGADVLLYHITTGELFNLGKVGEYAFDDSGTWLAYTMDTSDQVGNGVQLFNLKTNAVKPLESDRLLYRHLAWVDSSAALSVMRGKINETTRDTVFSIEAFTFAPTGPGKKLLFDPTASTDFPNGWKLASERAPRYAEDLSAVFFGIREAARPQRGQGAGRGNSPIAAGAPGAGGTINQGRTGGAGGDNAEEDPSLVLWHARDPRLQSQQLVQEAADRAFNYLSEYRFAESKFVRLADDDLRNITITTGDKYAYGTDNREYQQQASYSGRNYQDLYSVDLKTGARKLIMKKRPGGGGGGGGGGMSSSQAAVLGNGWTLLGARSGHG